ncbi:hypothetical protein K466DRAFT_591697 [Polyporus arcularius HHB13444]|uniref:Uncharacterized protein n=1 Tax=Polyporus arcularius HHB13444 TaxID=1314778 RepID=A0A5C3NUN2_9APHY|nr:hypothetical protein K466DRAFT_591697 [Polyporus arcularius HHB13444]
MSSWSKSSSVVMGGNMVMYSCPLRISSNDCRYGYDDTEDCTDDEVLYRLECI